ncbi:MAG TPA: LptE family protein [Ohtaekwangia sp.]
MKNNIHQSTSTSKKHVTSWIQLVVCIVLLITLPGIQACNVYSFSGMSTTAKSISFTEFYNNTDLGPPTMGQTFTNDIKNYFIQNTSLSVVQEEGELQMDGEITDYRLMPISPVATGDPNQINNAASTRLTITVKVTYVNTLDDAMSFKDKTFSFYKDFPNDQNLADVEEQYIKEIFQRIINDIFNASVANW